MQSLESIHRHAVNELGIKYQQLHNDGDHNEDELNNRYSDELESLEGKYEDEINCRAEYEMGK